ncbi:MAG: aminotransferase class I/II-fold pyridoxal phosphate-dependent enzyme [Candidatus Izemoplasma sp.]|nr:aminotransferase class I/II-fold pyridoxal phosphate-dependent enzyme [Candidatus Izemoplasma sp.]
MTFLNSLSDGKKMTDKVFKAAVKANEAKIKHGSENVVDATLGTLFDETETFCAFDSVWEPYKSISNIQKAKYAGGIPGNPSYLTTVYKWLFKDLTLHTKIVATPGGAGAVSATIHNILDPGQILLKPSLGWGPYNTMATEHGVKAVDYNLFSDDGFDIDNFKQKLANVMAKQGKVLAIINDPCHNPSGYTMTEDEWDEILTYVDMLAQRGPIIILQDIAYIDFSTNPDWKKHFKKYQNLSDNIMVVIAFSLSKTLTAYGARVGAAIAITSNQKELDKWHDAMVYTARSTWSTINNSMMTLFAKLYNDKSLYDAYLNEKSKYVSLLKERADIFIKEADQENLPYYPFVEGFFVTLRIDNADKEAIYKRLQDNNIFTVQVNNGLRIALCSVSKNKLKGLAKKIKACL